MTNIIVVDLDGTLVNSDLLVENLFLFIRLYPTQFFLLFIWLLQGKVFFKRQLANAVLPTVSTLPYHVDVLSWLKVQLENGKSLILATASDKRIASAVARHLGIFDEVLGTESINLSSQHKRTELVERYGEKGYDYVGNSMADIAVWSSASEIYVVNPERGVLTAASKIGQIKQVFNTRPNYFHAIAKTLRVHQWAKNLLIFVPLLASHRVAEFPLLLNGMLAFLAFGFCASSVYLLNDLLDLQDDRLHPSKCNRPLASGTFPILHALIYIPTLLITAFILSIVFLPWQFVVVLVAYYLITLIYSLWLKRIVMLDVVSLAILYTIRVIAGASAMFLVTTFWILAFCMFIFLSLAFVKRYTELKDAIVKGKTDLTAGRGYYPDDFELLASLGGASGYISVMVLALYINEATHGTLYNSPYWMWAACPLLLFWLSRVWLLAHRGLMHDDPIVFALRDSVSRWVALGFIGCFVLATL